MSTTPTAAPSCAKRNAPARPIPEAAAVTMPTLFCRRMVLAPKKLTLHRKGREGYAKDAKATLRREAPVNPADLEIYWRCAPKESPFATLRILRVLCGKALF